MLLVRVVEDMGDRLATVMRRFDAILDLGTPGPQLAAAMAARAPARLVRAAPVEATIGDGPWDGLVVDEEALPFPPESFDLVVSALSLQGVNDLPGALLQIRRALKPDGLFLGCLVGGRSLTELREAFAAAEAETLGGASPRVAPFADVRDMGGLLQRAGFALPVADVETLTLRYDHCSRWRMTCAPWARPIPSFCAIGARYAGPWPCARRRSTRSAFPTRTGACAPPSNSSGSPAGRRTRASRSRCGRARPVCGSPTALGTRENRLADKRDDEM